jgi:hypothetical protein
MLTAFAPKVNPSRLVIASGLRFISAAQQYQLNASGDFLILKLSAKIKIAA